MIQALEEKDDTNIIITSTVYPELNAISSLKRELLFVLKHIEHHHEYFEP
jgi:hypothetical protein